MICDGDKMSVWQLSILFSFLLFIFHFVENLWNGKKTNNLHRTNRYICCSVCCCSDKRLTLFENSGGNSIFSKLDCAQIHARIHAHRATQSTDEIPTEIPRSPRIWYEIYKYVYIYYIHQRIFVVMRVFVRWSLLGFNMFSQCFELEHMEFWSDLLSKARLSGYIIDLIKRENKWIRGRNDEIVRGRFQIIMR